MKLVKNNKVVKFPRSTKSAIGILNHALKSARTNDFNRVIIITQSKDGTLGCGWNNMSIINRIGMCEYAKNVALQDLYAESE